MAQTAGVLSRDRVCSECDSRKGGGGGGGVRLSHQQPSPSALTCILCPFFFSSFVGVDGGGGGEVGGCCDVGYVCIEWLLWISGKSGRFSECVSVLIPSAVLASAVLWD